MTIGTAYSTLLLSNASRISSIEASLRTISYFLPGRFQDSDVASESIISFLSLLSLYHSTLLAKAVASLPSPLRPKPSPHGRYTTDQTLKSKRYSLLAHSLTVIEHLQLLLEMAAAKHDEKSSGRATLATSTTAAETTVLVLESLKALLRIGLLHASGGRMGISPPVAEREIDPALVEKLGPELKKAMMRAHFQKKQKELPRSSADVLEMRGNGDWASTSRTGTGPIALEEEEEDDRDEDEGVGLVKEYWKGPRTGFERPTIASIRIVHNGGEELGAFGPPVGGSGVKSVQEYLFTKVLTQQDMKKPQDLVARLTGLAKLAELIWILRPVLYVLAMRKYGRRHTLPFLLSLALEYLSYSLRNSGRRAAASSKASGPMLMSEVEKNEESRRKRAFVWYLVRGPVWEGITKPRLEGISKSFENKPIIGYVSTLIQDYIPLLDKYHFYTS